MGLLWKKERSGYLAAKRCAFADGSCTWAYGAAT